MKKYIVEMGVIVSIILIVGINPAFAALSNTLIIQNTNVISTGNDLRITGELVNLGTEPISGVKISMIDKSISVTPRFLDRIIIEPGERIPFAVEVLKTDLGEQLSDLTVIEGSAADQSVRYEDFNVGQSEIVWFDDLAKAANSSARPWANPVVVRNIGNSTAQVFGVTVIYDEAGNILEVGLTSDLARDEEENKATILKPGEVVMINSFGNLPASIADKDVHHEVLVWGKVVDSEPSKGELQYIDDHNDQNTPLLFAPFLMLGSVAGVSGWIAYRRIKPRKLALLALALIILIFVPSIATIFATDVAPPWDGGNGNPPSLIDWNLSNGDALAEAFSTGSPQTTYVYTRKSFTVYPTKLIGVYSGGNLVGTLHADSGAGVEATVLVETVLYDSYLNEIDTDTQYSNSASNGQNKEIDTNTQGGVGDCGRDTDYWVLNLMTVEADGESSQTAYADFREWVLWWATKALFGGWAEVEVLGDPTC